MGDTLNQKILAYARGKKGKPSGNGECWTLAHEALSESGALSSAALGPMGKDADYVWGDLVADLKDVQPGDIMQFRDFQITTTTTTKRTFPDGAFDEKSPSSVASRGHHTAIVAESKGNGIFLIFEQHVKPLGKKVQLHEIRTKNSSVTNKVEFRKEINPYTKKVQEAKVEVTVDIEVTGTIYAYRPKLK